MFPSPRNLVQLSCQKNNFLMMEIEGLVETLSSDCELTKLDAWELNIFSHGWCKILVAGRSNTKNIPRIYFGTRVFITVLKTAW